MVTCNSCRDIYIIRSPFQEQYIQNAWQKQYHKTLPFSSATPLPRIVKLRAHMLHIRKRMGRRPMALFARRHLHRPALLSGAPQGALGRCILCRPLLQCLSTCGFQGRGALAFEVQIQIDVTIKSQLHVRGQIQFHMRLDAWIYISPSSAATTRFAPGNLEVAAQVFGRIRGYLLYFFPWQFWGQVLARIWHRFFATDF